MNMMHGLSLMREMNWNEFDMTYYTSRVVEKRVGTNETQDILKFDYYPKYYTFNSTRKSFSCVQTI